MLRALAPKALRFALSNSATAMSEALPAATLAARRWEVTLKEADLNTSSWSTGSLQWGHQHRFYTAQPLRAEEPNDREVQPHPSAGTKESDMLMHPVYSKQYVESVAPKHRVPATFQDKTGYWAVWLLRTTFDKLTGYGKNMTTAKWLQRMLYLETVAGVPGMVAGGLRHMRSLRTMQRDHGWIHTLLEEAENERMHLLTFMQMRHPGPLFRAAVLGGQGVFLTLYSFFYIISPRHCHAFVSYLEEEAVRTYTRVIEDIDSGKLPEWKDAPAPQIALEYWRLPEGATVRDMFLAVRADEACHAHVNAVFAELKATDPNPFATCIPHSGGDLLHPQS